MNNYYSTDPADLACELIGLSSTLATLRLLIKPNPDALTTGSAPTETTLDNSFYSIERALQRIADELNNIEAQQLKTGK